MITVEHVLKSKKPTDQTVQNHRKSLRWQIISDIIHLVKAMEVKHINGWEGIPFSNIDGLMYQSRYSTEELLVLEDVLENKFEGFLYDIYQKEYYQL
ncbi:hypothetical protein R4Z10_11335 [Niallia sp. XMNu-256]|uniref:hypothetical protein n=1 Tax=Niallia sp. XMNu-256 TaxID=3082444 RepID=UPI0030D28438